MIWDQLNAELRAKIGPRLQQRMDELEELYQHFGWVVADQRRQEDPASEERYRSELQREVETAGDKAKAWYNLGYFEAQLGALAAAQEAYQRAYEVQSRFFDACFNLADLLERNGHAEQAEEWYVRSIRINPGYVFGYTNLLRAYYARLPEQMPKRLTRSVQETLARAQKWTEELKGIYKRTKWPEEEAKALNNAGVLSFWRGELGEAGNWLQWAQDRLEQEISLAEATIQANMGLVSAAMGREDVAQDFYSKAQDLVRGRAEEPLRVALGLSAQKDLSQARPTVLQARPAPPLADQPDFVLTINFRQEPQEKESVSQGARVRLLQDQARASQAALLWMLDDMGVRKKSGAWLVNTLTATLSATELVSLLLGMNERIRALPDVTQVELAEGRSWALYSVLDRSILSSVSQCSPQDIEAHVAAAEALVGGGSPWVQGLTGAGNTIAVLDTGVSPEHLDLEGKVRFARDAEIENAEIFGEVVQGSHHNYTLELQAGVRELTLLLELGLALEGRQVQNHIEADLEVKVFAPGADWALKSQSLREEPLPEGGIKQTHVYAISEPGQYRILIRGRKIAVGDSPWRGVLFRLMAMDTGGYPDRRLTFSSPYDDQGHGTHVAGIIAGTGRASDGQYRGIAPGATLISAKVLDYTGQRSGRAAPANLEKTIEWAVGMGANIINMSFGSLRRDGCSGSCEFCLAANKAVSELGVIVVVAAGNEGPTGGTIGCPGNASDVITVGSCTLDGRISDFSSRGPTVDGRHKPDLVAPGEGIISCFSPRHFVAVGKLEGEGYILHPYSPLAANNAYIGFSGTSMAAPLVSGAIALLLQADPTLTPADVKTLLTETAVPLQDEHGIPYPEDVQGAGMLNLTEALRRLRHAVVEEVVAAQASYPATAQEIRLRVRVHNTGQDDLVPLVALLRLAKVESGMAWQERKALDLLEAGASKDLTFVWRPKSALAPGHYTVLVQLSGILSDQTGPLEVRRNLEYHTLGPVPCFEVTA